LLYLKKDQPDVYNSPKFLDNFGNDYISDSYLLDMCTSDAFFEKLFNCLGGSDINTLGELSEDLHEGKTYYEIYSNCKNERVVKGKYTESQVAEQLKNNMEEQKRLIEQVSCVPEIREKLFGAYGANKELLSRHLMMMYCNLCRYEWESDLDAGMGIYKAFSFNMREVYTDLSMFLNIPFSQCGDAYILGNLLKSSNFKFVPWQNNSSVYDSVYGQNSFVPKPVQLSIYSISGVLNNITNKKVGGASGLDEFFR
jgi:hypothetical protein